MRLRTTALMLLSVFALTSLTAKASLTPITIPGEGIPGGIYTDVTTLIDISGEADFSIHPSITDGTQTVTFGTPLEKRTVPTNWATWGAPAATESASPPVLALFGIDVLRMDLDVPSYVFGFELEGNDFVEAQYTISFYEAGNPLAVGSISLPIVGASGAKLVAAYTFDTPFSSVVIENTDGLADGFAIAQVRYSTNVPVPEPASVIMIVQAIGAVGFYGWRKRRQIAQSV